MFPGLIFFKTFNKCVMILDFAYAGTIWKSSKVFSTLYPRAEGFSKTKMVVTSADDDNKDVDDFN